MGKSAEMAIKTRTTQRAIELLDIICEPYRGCDAEFEAEDPNRRGFKHPMYGDYTDPDAPMGQLIAEEFGEPGRDYKAGWPENEDVVEAWHEGPYLEFCRRYQFC